MYRVSTNISKEKFARIISGNKGYIPSKVRRALQEDKKSKLLFKKSVRRDEALYTIKYLMKKGLLTSSKGAYKLVQTAAREQWKEEQKKKEEKKAEAKKQKQGEGEEGAERQRHIEGAIRRDILQELMEKGWEEKEDGTDRGPLARPSVAEEAEQERQKREERFTSDLEKKEESSRPKSATRRGPELPELPDIDIG